ncbi:PKD domain-containing protein [Aeromicrobium senzhongii]|uniref:PKD domain-containing protein n=1 Tax=Aeromicrobium senzhongii TaxID=2663859 RepID=A0ABX6ST83_9ACTN|nr:PKD domain-containing protein [Aeromicrobium senzhongii]QNL93485.1 PKD domain-containing protein [Aeromicrobium senzhongii]
MTASRLCRLVGALAVTTTMTVGAMTAIEIAQVPVAAADCPDEDYDGSHDGEGTVDLCATQPGQTPGPNPGPPGNTTIPIPGPWTQRVHTPWCPANIVRATGPGVRDYVMDPDVMCGGANECPEEGDFRYWVFERRMTADNVAEDEEAGFSRAGVVCRGLDEPRESEPPTITVDDIIDRARALAPTPSFVIEPAAMSYVNVPTNFAAEATEVTVDVTLFGLTIPVVFTPGEVTWSFGDGGSGSGVGVRNAAVGQAGAVEHAYRRAGSYDVTLTVAYDLVINLPNGPLSFPAAMNRSAPAQSLAVGEIQSVVTEVD